MKRIFILIFVFLSFSFSLKALDYDFVSAKQAYTELVSGVPNLYEDYELYGVMTSGGPNLKFKIDFETGDAQIWTFIFKSKNIEDNSIYYYEVFREDEAFTYDLQVDDGSSDESRILVNTWKNTTDLANEYMKSSLLTDFYNANIEEDTFGIHYVLMYSEELNTDVWSVYLATSKEEMIICSYQSTSLLLIECLENPMSVQDELARATKLFPQPSKDYLNIELPFSGDVRLELYNTNGVVLKSMNLNTNGEVQFSTSDLPTGVYNLVIKGSNSTFSKKVIVTR